MTIEVLFLIINNHTSTQQRVDSIVRTQCLCDKDNCTMFSSCGMVRRLWVWIHHTLECAVFSNTVGVDRGSSRSIVSSSLDLSLVKEARTRIPIAIVPLPACSCSKKRSIVFPASHLG
jgi:hypothetical protein